MDEDQKKAILAVTDDSMRGIDAQLRNVYISHADNFSDPEEIYQTFVVVLAQTLGRHIAAFPAELRDEIALEALKIQEEMTALVITETAKAELAKAQVASEDVPYDLSKMTPEGNA